MAPEGDCAPLRLGNKSATDAAAPQIGMYPQQVNEQPARVKITDQSGSNLIHTIAHKKPEIVVTPVAQESFIVVAETFVDEFPIAPRRIVFNAEAAARRQVHNRSFLLSSHGGRHVSLDRSVRQLPVHLEREEGVLHRLISRLTSMPLVSTI
jgi:hypothetical protein